ncbi:hypothetical protein OPT61_g1931 [Boeremia exigua]|uniref:Uncharacterized protein n=1 Tax=Boeremia exigua TaxID=749465 RepID=A0ACC2INI0_9PLEO|nr:hypothetical protein OPT61_g1931 [Boeremia exigua]
MESTSTSVSIPVAVDRCARSFLSLAEILQQPTRFAYQLSADSILDEFDRFKLWAGNIAAHKKGRRSLEYRLRDAVQLRLETLDLLQSLSSVLDDKMTIVEGVRLPWDEEVFSDSDSDLDCSGRENESKTVNALQGNTELKQLHARSRSLITSLMRLTMAIRHPAPTRQILRIDKSYYEPYDVQHVQAKFSNSAPYLITRLGRAISSRRQYLTYREKHCQKLSKGIEAIGFEDLRTEQTDNSTEATPIPTLDPASQPESSFFNDNETMSQTSYASSFKNTIRTPHLPKEASKGEPYECPLCFSLIAIYTTATWKYDLHPYCCTFEHCTTADLLYESRHAWFAHEVEAHRSIFQCAEDCEETFTTEMEFQSHVQSRHPDLAAPAVFSALKRTSARSADLSQKAQCKLCNESMNLRRLRKHLGQHQEQLALFALPAAVEESDVDTEDMDEKEPQPEHDGEDETDDSREIVAKCDDVDDDNKIKDANENASTTSEFFPKSETDSSDDISVKLVRRSALIAALNLADAKEAAQNEKADREAPKIIQSAAGITSEEIGAMALTETEATKFMHDQTLREISPAKAKAEVDEPMRRKTGIPDTGVDTGVGEMVSDDAPPIFLKDALGRKFEFPWRTCKTWRGMEALIKQAFLNIDILELHVSQGHYDLVSPYGEIVLPSVWEHIVQPGWAMTMYMWPMREPPPEEEAPPSPKEEARPLLPSPPSSPSSSESSHA